MSESHCRLKHSCNRGLLFLYNCLQTCYSLYINRKGVGIPGSSRNDMEIMI